MCLRGNVLEGKEESGLGGITSECFSELFVCVWGGGRCGCTYLDNVNQQANKLLSGLPDTCKGSRARSCFIGPGDAGKFTGKASPVSGPLGGLEAGAQGLHLFLQEKYLWGSLIVLWLGGK